VEGSHRNFNIFGRRLTEGGAGSFLDGGRSGGCGARFGERGAELVRLGGGVEGRGERRTPRRGENNRGFT